MTLSKPGRANSGGLKNSTPLPTSPRFRSAKYKGGVCTIRGRNGLGSELAGKIQNLVGVFPVLTLATVYVVIRCCCRPRYLEVDML